MRRNKKGTSVLKLASVNKLPFSYFWSLDFEFLILCWKWDILKEYLFSWWSDNPLTMNPFTLTTKESMIILHRQSHKSSIYMFFYIDMNDIKKVSSLLPWTTSTCPYHHGGRDDHMTIIIKSSGNHMHHASLSTQQVMITHFVTWNLHTSSYDHLPGVHL